jgi:hypothetical protein
MRAQRKLPVLNVSEEEITDAPKLPYTLSNVHEVL